MRIAFVTPEFITEDCYDGGLANYLARISTRLAENGHEITVFVSSNVDEVLEWRGVSICRVAIGGAPCFPLQISYCRFVLHLTGFMPGGNSDRLCGLYTR